MLPGPFLTPPQSLLLLFPLLRPSRARHAQFNTRPSSKDSPSGPSAAPQCSPPPPSVKQLRVLHVPHNRRHAPATQHTQRHNVVPPLLPNHERNAQRVLSHVLHALQPPADQVGRHAQHLVVFLVLGADPHTSRSTAWVLRKAAERCHFCGRSKCAGTTATLTPSHIRSLYSPTQKGGAVGREARRTAHAQGHKQKQCHTCRTAIKSLAHNTHTAAKRGTRRIQLHGAVLYFSPSRRIGIASHTRSWRIGVPHSQ
ncbi:hypothetical protein TcCL_NonESM08832 [Trypanosoma cruzi]|nr:hypothetical protein TcCL_NonESM08832 [Trypanosoma cruzi]